MLDFLHYLVAYQYWIYGILILLALSSFRRMLSACQERRHTIFGLERENAQRRLNSALALFLILLLLIGSEFVILTFVMPEWPQVMTLIDPPDGPEEDEKMIVREDGQVAANMEEGGLIVNGEAVLPEVTGEGVQLLGGCMPGSLEWISPVNNEEINGNYYLNATVNVKDMAFYQYSYSPINDQQSWSVISAGNLPVIEGELGLWATSQVPNGDYVLRMTVFGLDNQPLDPCDVKIRILNDMG